jgi:hypothetical protein
MFMPWFTHLNMHLNMVPLHTLKPEVWPDPGHITVRIDLDVYLRASGLQEGE